MEIKRAVVYPRSRFGTITHVYMFKGKTFFSFILLRLELITKCAFLCSIKIMKMARQLSSKYCRPRRRYHTYLLYCDSSLPSSRSSLSFIYWYCDSSLPSSRSSLSFIYWYCDSSLSSSSSLSYVFTGIVIHRCRRHRYHTYLLVL